MAQLRRTTFWGEETPWGSYLNTGTHSVFTSYEISSNHRLNNQLTNLKKKKRKMMVQTSVVVWNRWCTSSSTLFVFQRDHCLWYSPVQNNSVPCNGVCFCILANTQRKLNRILNRLGVGNPTLLCGAVLSTSALGFLFLTAGHPVVWLSFYIGRMVCFPRMQCGVSKLKESSCVLRLNHTWLILGKSVEVSWSRKQQEDRAERVQRVMKSNAPDTLLPNNKNTDVHCYSCPLFFIFISGAPHRGIFRNEPSGAKWIMCASHSSHDALPFSPAGRTSLPLRPLYVPLCLELCHGDTIQLRSRLSQREVSVPLSRLPPGW